MASKRSRNAPGRKTRHRQASVASLKKKAWKLLSELVRRSTAYPAGDLAEGFVRCYTCGHTGHWKYIQAGHAIPGRTGAVLFDEEIIRPQCYRCNVALRGNYPVFTAKLIRERAENDHEHPLETMSRAMDWWEEKLCKSRQVIHWTRPELEELIESYKQRLEKLGH